MVKDFLLFLRYWQPVVLRCSLYLLIGFITTFLDKTEKLLDFDGFNFWMWLRTLLSCLLSGLLIIRVFVDNSVSNLKIDKVKSGETEHLSKSDVEKIRKDLGLPSLS